MNADHWHDNPWDDGVTAAPAEAPPEAAHTPTTPLGDIAPVTMAAAGSLIAGALGCLAASWAGFLIGVLVMLAAAAAGAVLVWRLTAAT